ncbi:hypothetical protein QCN29_34630 [Streptomyces sp. HNM0663]|uniref:Uncharacterized protein n=1 Tax=Streptomyces chengmaiensis TaxID=3040919 RepID=A0ABT6HYN8_9ACTN|nr:hypothetical protein [Streptomyces chengmaiensis]MDH2393807.1 hypothetical protein [Streptomyces chengmaiensis]
MTEKRERRCFCGCGESAEMGRWFVQGHDVTAVAALRAVEELRLAYQLVLLGYGPERSVVQTAVEGAGWVRCPGCSYVGPSAAHTCTAEAPAGDQSPSSPEPGAEQEQEPASAAALLAESGAAQGRLLPEADDRMWEAVPLHLRQQLRGPAHQLVSPAQGPLTARENRHLLSAVRAASRMRMTGAHWTLLLTTGRESFGGPRSQRAQRLCEALEQVAAEHTAPAPASPHVRHVERTIRHLH